MPRNLRGRGNDIGMKEATARAQECKEEIVFADENAKLAWEIGQGVDRITALLPPESSALKTETITFEAKYLSRGTYAVFFSGTVIATDRKGVLVVPERSLHVLDQLQIPYQVVS